MNSQQKIKFDFHASAEARKKYDFEESLFSVTGNLIIADFSTARILSNRINNTRVAEGRNDGNTTPGLINSIGLLHELFHFIIRNYEEKENPGVFSRSEEWLNKKLGEDELRKLLLKFVKNFPPLSVFKNELTDEQYFHGETEGRKNSQIILEELILLHLENINPAFASLKEMFDDGDLQTQTRYNDFIVETDNFFEDEKPFGAENNSLFKSLKKVILENPNDVNAQLNYLKNFWKVSLPENLLQKILRGHDLIQEDVKIFVQHGTVGTPPVPQYKFFSEVEVKQFKEDISTGKKVELPSAEFNYQLEPEQFTEDTDWMPKVVMIAKNIFVWLDQLSAKYEREIRTLDQIPDEEIQQLAMWNFTALWLIGVWQRSPASKKIKQFCGNPEAASSAYSLYDYTIANELGGESAFNILKEKCWKFGVRLASDMVPNHCGIFSKWILENPDYFIQSSTPPYPSYTFTGPDLSDDVRVQIRIEDKYYTRRDAAVVFQTIENRTGKIRYIYHGNDGTNTPWNDTAQLNLLHPEVRERLIQTIMNVARKFPIIRFDAAMTLAKKHFQRLWFPQPGSGGAIPSRSDYSMTKDFFDKVLPNEFWREVVDRMNVELPNTLLLAEAFWLMEGYFVRTLGMHRVYNSAFMHMFMKEENQKFKELIKNTLEFNPEILKRYVNFMSNPDEETAVNQFGKGDKYFGTAVMMITLPGLPMFAHGQIEGFIEKYGMEYTRAYYREFVDVYLVERHEKEIFPLTKLRYLFSQVENFELYDFISANDEVNEDVIAFSNREKNNNALVIYNNSYERVVGRIQFGAPKVGGKEESTVRIKNIFDALHFKYDQNIYYIASEQKSKLEFIFSASEIHDNGFALDLSGYEYAVYLNFIEVYDQNGEYKRIHQHLGGKGAKSIEAAIQELNLVPLHEAIAELFTRTNIDELKIFANESLKNIGDDSLQISSSLKTKISAVVSEIKLLNQSTIDEIEVIKKLQSDLLNYKVSSDELKKNDLNDLLLKYFHFAQNGGKKIYDDLIILYYVVKRILVTTRNVNKNENAIELYSSLMLEQPLWQALIRLDDNYHTVKLEFDLLKILASGLESFSEIFAGKPKKDETETQTHLISLLKKSNIKHFIGYHDYLGTGYVRKENFEILLQWDFYLHYLRRSDALIKERLAKKKKPDLTKPLHKKSFKKEIKKIGKNVSALIDLMGNEEYIYLNFLESLEKDFSLSPKKKNKKQKKLKELK